MKNKTLPLFLAFIAAFSGCSMKKMALRSTVDLLPEGTKAFYEERDPKLAEDSFPGQIKLIELLLKNDPTNPDLIVYASQAFGGYAFLFIEGKDPIRASGLYDRGRDYGLGFLNQKLGMTLRQENDLEKFSKALAKLSKRDMPILFWTAYCWGGQINLNLQNAQAIADLPKVELMMLRVRELSPETFYGGPDLFLGAYFGSRPKMFGGDLKKSKAYFDNALAFSHSKFLMAFVLYAKYYAVPAQDKALFTDLLKQVVEAPADDFPEQRLSNEVARLKAKKLMEDIHEYFD